VPAGHSVRSDQIEALFPVGPESAKRNPKQLVEQTQSWFSMPAFQDNELLAKSKVLQHQVLARTKEAKGGSEPDPEKVEHGGIVIPDRILIRAFMSLISQSDGIVASHRLWYGLKRQMASSASLPILRPSCPDESPRPPSGFTRVAAHEFWELINHERL